MTTPSRARASFGRRTAKCASSRSKHSGWRICAPTTRTRVAATWTQSRKACANAANTGRSLSISAPTPRTISRSSPGTTPTWPRKNSDGRRSRPRRSTWTTSRPPRSCWPTTVSPTSEDTTTRRSPTCSPRSTTWKAPDGSRTTSTGCSTHCPKRTTIRRSRRSTFRTTPNRG